MTITNAHAGCMWVLMTVLIVPFLIAIPVLWMQPLDETGLYVLIPFTLVFLLALPFLLKEIFGSKLVGLTVIRADEDASGGTIFVRERGLRSRDSYAKNIADIDHLQLEVSDNDGEFFFVKLVFSDGSKIPIIHGNYRPGVLEEADNVLEFLRRDLPDLEIREVKV